MSKTQATDADLRTATSHTLHAQIEDLSNSAPHPVVKAEESTAVIDNSRAVENGDSLGLQIDTGHPVRRYGAEVASEHLRYMGYMATLPVPDALPPTAGLEPFMSGFSIKLGKAVESGVGLQILPSRYAHETVGFTKPCFYFVGRTVWCPGEQHALAFCPTHLYDPLWRKWWLRPRETAPVGQTRELFVASGANQGVVYVGTYTLHSLRHIHPPGSEIPPKVVGRQLNMSAGIPDHDPEPKAHFSGGILPTECFGLQRVGFNEELYSSLLRCIQPAPKRQVGEDDGDGKINKRKRGEIILNYG